MRATGPVNHVGAYFYGSSTSVGSGGALTFNCTPSITLNGAQNLVTIPKTGFYQVSYSAWADVGGGTEYISLTLQLNGVTVPHSITNGPAITSNNPANNTIIFNVSVINSTGASFSAPNQNLA
ncbi:hypothetical protein [Bacillus thuringiensis]|uniref:hypothetical protein n=1 Tax=Bacillus thuringiensis TaxID=1428 RepID=UPI00119FEDC7|nr:hypothetical protein [Bacillus thuringiensis]